MFTIEIEKMRIGRHSGRIWDRPSVRSWIIFVAHAAPRPRPLIIEVGSVSEAERLADDLGIVVSEVAVVPPYAVHLLTPEVRIRS